MSPPTYDAAQLLQTRQIPRPGNALTVRTLLRHFALVNYTLPPERLRPHIPADRFDIQTVEIDGQPRAMLSAVPFLDVDFRFARLAPWLRWKFGQTNHRAYVIDRRTGLPGVWFFGTTLGSPLVYAARGLWRIPWHYARYRIDVHVDPTTGAYERYRYNVNSAWCAARIDLVGDAAPIGLTPGFASMTEQTLVLTHPVDGFFHRLDGALGGYSIWHPIMTLTRAQPRDLWFSLYERLGLLSAGEMQRPHSVFICREIPFEVYLPPRRLA
ncbi:MAG TPA: DUF2071 domain-containing protein [Thermoflexales bacterium]|nr:DUF2071 domain-containing protein [Thermoflexales bacterium]HQY24479.1 DUF2071 domain-containing protein [Thermoflexales bacterium]HQZ52460.1 DUF2071 domain-containing protein [Thermoflexales bacterium]